MISTESLQIGQMVTSMSGRDKGRRMIIIEIVDNIFVRVIDGDLRRVEKPKLKKIKHLNVSHHIAEDVVKSLNDGVKLTNDRVLKALENFIFKD